MISKIFSFLKNNNSNDLITDIKSMKFSKNVQFKDKKKFYSTDFKYELLDPIIEKKEVFSIYTGVCKDSDLLLFQSFNLIFDIYVLETGFLGREYMKTISFCAKDENNSREIIFRVISGVGFFLLENTKNRNEVKFIKVKAQDFVLIPKDWAFIIINSSSQNKFILSCLRDKSVKIQKNLFKDQNGAFLFYTKTGFVKNQNVGPYYHLEEYTGDFLQDYIFDKQLGLYKEFVHFPDKFHFLKD